MKMYMVIRIKLESQVRILLISGLAFVALYAFTINSVSLRLNGKRLRAFHDSILEKTKTTGGKKKHVEIKVLFWTNLHGHKNWWHLTERPLVRRCGDCSCRFSYDKRELGQSDAVLFEYGKNLTRLSSENANVRSALGQRVRHWPNLKPTTGMNIPDVHDPGQYWILYNHEGTIHKKYDIYKKIHPNVFNLSATFKEEADIVLKYGACVPRTTQIHQERSTTPERQSRLVLWHVSNCDTSSRRMDYVKEMSKYIQVDIRGNCGQSFDTQYNDSRIHFGELPSNEILSEINMYKFYLSFENTYRDQYITEKVYKILGDKVRVIPVVRGAGPYKKYLPPGSYVDAADFTSPKNLAQYLHKLDQNSTLYNDYIKARDTHRCYNYFGNTRTWPCDICKQIYNLKQNGIKKTLSQRDIDQLFLR